MPAQAMQDTSMLFRQLTRRASVSQNPIVFATSGGNFPSSPVQIGLGHTGWLSRILINLTGTIAIGSGTISGGWPTYPPLPWSLFRRIRVFTNTNSQLITTTGWGMYLLNRARRRNSFWDINPETNYLSAGNTTGASDNANNAQLVFRSPTPGATPTQNTTYYINATLEIPIMTSDSMMLGGLFLQSDAINAQLEITPPVAADYAGTIAGGTVTPNFVINVQTEWFEQPGDLRIHPNVQFSHDIIETNYPLTGTGQQNWRLPVGNTYLRTIACLENNGAGIPGYEISQVGMGYAQTQFPTIQPYGQHQAAAKLDYGAVWPDGTFAFDQDLGSGVAGLEEPRDFLNTSQFTDFQIQAVISSAVSLSGSNLRVLTEQLAPIGQASLGRIYSGPWSGVIGG